MVTSLAFGQQTWALHEGRQILSSFYSCWGTKATKSPCYECSNLNHPYARQKQNEKKALDRMKMKAELKWDELQAQAQQMEHVKRPLLVCFSLRNLVGLHWDSGMGGGVHPTKCMGRP